MVTLLRPDTCRMCKFAAQLNNVPKGEPELECHGAPPQIVAFVVPSPQGPQVSVQTIFPRVGADWNCGAFRPKISDPAALKQ